VGYWKGKAIQLSEVDEVDMAEQDGRRMSVELQRAEREAQEAQEAQYEEMTRKRYSQDSVNHPNHYNMHPSGIECIDIVEEFGFNIGNAIKYAWRCGLKDGADEIQDLEKSAWYLQREIERRKRERRRAT